MKKLVFCGGGTAGHVVPNMNIINALKDKYEMSYIGSGSNIEIVLLEKVKIDYYIISSGKLRRYFDLRNFTDMFKVLWGTYQSYKILSYLSPDLIYSKGGYVSVPVVIAAWIKNIPVVTHESDLTLGLANKINSWFSRVICLAFDSATKQLSPKFIKYEGEYSKDNKYYLVTGIPIKVNTPHISKDEFLSKYNLDKNKKTLFFLGGSQGATFINNLVLQNKIILTGKYNILHQCGTLHYEKLLTQTKKLSNYVLLDFLNQEDMSLCYSFADVVISRAGATSLFEILSYKKKSILIPLPTLGSRGDQLQNAKILKDKKLAEMILQENFTEEKFFEKLYQLLKDRDIQTSLNAFTVNNSIKPYIDLIEKIIH